MAAGVLGLDPAIEQDGGVIRPHQAAVATAAGAKGLKLEDHGSPLCFVIQPLWPDGRLHHNRDGAVRLRRLWPPAYPLSGDKAVYIRNRRDRHRQSAQPKPKIGSAPSWTSAVANLHSSDFGPSTTMAPIISACRKDDGAELPDTDTPAPPQVEDGDVDASSRD